MATLDSSLLVFLGGSSRLVNNTTRKGGYGELDVARGDTGSCHGCYGLVSNIIPLSYIVCLEGTMAAFTPTSQSKDFSCTVTSLDFSSMVTSIDFIWKQKGTQE